MAQPNRTEQYQYADRSEYLKIQIARSKQKFGYCKVFFEDVFRYRHLLQVDGSRRKTPNRPGQILCLGVRSGAEVDIFRSVFLSPLTRLSVIQHWIERQDRTKDAVSKMQLSKYVNWLIPKDGRNVWGVELNPDTRRADVFVGSFDELPMEWSSKFQLVFSNSFDHSQDPERTITEWKRVADRGAYLTIAFPADHEPNQNDPVGKITLGMLQELVDAELVFASDTLNRAGYREACFYLK